MVDFFFLLCSDLNLLFFNKIVRFIIIDSNIFAFIIDDFSIFEASSILGPTGQLTSLHIIFTLFSMEHPTIETIFRTIRTTSITRHTLFSTFTPTTFTSLSTDIATSQFRTKLIIITIDSITKLTDPEQLPFVQGLQSIITCIIYSEDFKKVRIETKLFYRFDFFLARTFGSWRQITECYLFFVGFQFESEFILFG